MKCLMTGNEAVARGFYEAGGSIASAYPGTPSTEILENLSSYKDIYSEWAPNEKVALEVAIGASVAGARSIATMKHVGVNVAADGIMTYSYLGVNGGMILVSADDPGMHSSQNEQDNRLFAKFAKIAMVEPSDSQESKDFIKDAFEISEKFDTPVLFRMTTRVCHSKSIVEFGEKIDQVIKPYQRDIQKFVATPSNAQRCHVEVEKRLIELEKFSNETHLNKIEWNDKKIGIITSGIAYQYAKEVFGDKASYLKLGFTYPLPFKKIEDFAKEVDVLYVIEELEPYIEDQIKAKGIDCIGKDKIPNTLELNPDIVAKSLLNEENTLVENIDVLQEEVIKRPPTLCAGCPHRGFFYSLAKRKNIMITGDIGCYTLGCAEPLNAMDTCICMGASVSAGHGAQVAFNHHKVDKKVIGVIGDSTFFHSGITSLIDIVYNRGNSVTAILDNRITGMTGHQENPGSGYTLMGDKAPIIDIETLCKAIGVENIFVINPLNLQEVDEAINKALACETPAVIITKWPCVLKKLSQEDKAQFDCSRKLYEVNKDKCKKCKMCIKTGCPAISFDECSNIDKTMCVGCSVCAQVCKFDAIERVGE